MKIYKAPQAIPSYIIEPSIFLAGSIEQGTAENWQMRIEKSLSDMDVVLFNPRRADWDLTWEQSRNNPQFLEQVTWELTALESCDIIALRFDPATKSPISLLEMGLFAHSGKLHVCCPPGFWRKGNVEIVCDRYDIPFFEDEAVWLTSIRKEVDSLIQLFV